MANTPSAAKSPCPSPHLPEDPGTSTRHIRFSTPPSSLCDSSAELSLPSSVSRRVRTRPEDPSSLAILAAVCSSPSVRWDGVKHQYGEGHGKSIWCEDLRRAHGPSPKTHIVDPSSPITTPTYGDRALAFRDTIKEEMVNYGIEDSQKAPVSEEMHYSAIEDDDEDLPAPMLPQVQDYFSEFPSSPPTLVFSSPSNRYDYSSSSERSFTLPLSSPSLPSQRRITVATPIEPEQSAGIDGGHDPIVSVLPEGPSPRGPNNLHEVDSTPSTSEGHVMPILTVGPIESKISPVEVLLTDREPTSSPSLSPIQAPGPLPLRCVDLTFSPLSSLMSSPLSEVMEEAPSSPTASRFSVVSEAISSRSTSPDTDMMNASSRVKVTGRRASANVAGTRTRRISGLPDRKRWQRSDTAPPETTPSKRPRQSSPPSPVSRPQQVSRLSFPRSPSPHYNVPTTSRTALDEHRHVHKKQKRKTQLTNVSTSSKGKRSSHSSRFTEPQHSPKGRKSESSHKRPNCSALDPVLDVPSSAELTSLPVTGFLVETLALSRASAIAAPELLRAVLKSQPHLMEERSEKSWLELVRCILERVSMFGRIERRGTDAADRPLEDQWFYIPENDEENGRAELLKGLMPKKRDVTKRSKQYYFEPVQKVSRWDPEED